MTEEDHSQDIADLTRAHQAEIKRRDMAYQFMSQNLAQHVERETLLTNALKSAQLFIDQLISDLRVAGGEPTKGLIAAHGKWVESMHKLLGREEDA